MITTIATHQHIVTNAITEGYIGKYANGIALHWTRSGHSLRLDNVIVSRTVARVLRAAGIPGYSKGTMVIIPPLHD